MSYRTALISLAILLLLVGYWGVAAQPAKNLSAGSKSKSAKQATKQLEPKLGATPVVIDVQRWPADDTIVVHIVWGLNDTASTDWSGRVEAVNTKIVRLRPWRFGPDMKIDEASFAWKCGTWLGPTPLDRVFDRHLPNMPQPIVQAGVLIDLAGDSAARGQLEIETKQGKATIDVGQLLTSGPRKLLEGRALASAAIFGRPIATRLDANEQRWFDDPALAVRPDRGDVGAVAYLAYSQATTSDAIFVRRYDGGRWQEAECVSAAEGDHHRVAAAYESNGALWVVYSAQIEGNWDLYARRFYDGRWSDVQRLTTDAQPDFNAVIVAHPTQASLWLVWQGFRTGQSEILARRWNGNAWGVEQRLSSSPRNDWHPTATILNDGGIAVAWDTYDEGNYDIRCRRTAPSRTDAWMDEVRVTKGEPYEARPSIACDRANRLWIAYETSGPYWGKDTGFMLELAQAPQGTRLYEGRKVQVAVLDSQSNPLHVAPQPALGMTLNPTLHEQLEYPQLAVDPAGGMYLVARRRALLSISRRGVGRMFAYDLLVSRFDPRSATWSEPTIAADSLGRLDSVSGIGATDTGLWLAWSCDHRNYSTNRPDAASIFAGRFAWPTGHDPLDVSSVLLPPAVALPESLPTAPHTQEAADVARLRNYTLSVGEKTYHIFRGDMHRHTETSSDGGGDGSMTDAYRYAIDAAAMDFLLVTDHHDGGREYDWWRREKFNDLYRIGESFTGLFGYERSVSYPQGHRNLFYAQRGTRPLANDPREGPRGELDTGPLLYPHLRARGGICFSHTSATGMGTDWRDNDPELEPLVEIFQGDRTNYEKLGAPWSADASQVGTQEGGFEPLGYVNLALQKGYKLGFQASSDHLSTHLSYSCILAERNTRTSLMAAMKQRHAYAATDNILLDMRAMGVDGEHIMGDVFQVQGVPKFRVHVVGTGKLSDVVLIKNDRVVYAAQPTGNETSFEFTDMEGTPGKESYYYVRVVQANRQLAWGSPMWVTGR